MPQTASITHPSKVSLIKTVFRIDEQIRNEKKRVHFAPKQQTLYFLATRPANITAEPIYELQVFPSNCPSLGKGIWLSKVSQMKQEPYCQLDFLRAGLDSERQDEELFQLEDGLSIYRAGVEYFLVGEVAVYNLEFRKEILVHFTFNDWRTKSVAPAKYTSSIATLRIDKFKFSIPLPTQCPNKLELAVEYNVCGRTYWDSLNGLNYKFGIQRVPIRFDEAPTDMSQSEDIAESEKSEISSTSIPIPPRKPCHSPPSLPSLCKSSRSDAAFNLPKIASLTTSTTPIILPSRAASWDCTKSFTLMAMAAKRTQWTVN